MCVFERENESTLGCKDIIKFTFAAYFVDIASNIGATLMHGLPVMKSSELKEQSAI
jgi:hypothetical protein